jgi:hypothetical protein
MDETLQIDAHETINIHPICPQTRGSCQNFITNDSHELSIAHRSHCVCRRQPHRGQSKASIFGCRPQQTLTTKAVHRQDYMHNIHPDSAPRNFTRFPVVCADIRGYRTADSARAFIVSRSHGAISFPPPPRARKSLACYISQNFMTAVLPHGEQWRRHPILYHRQSNIEYVTSRADFGLTFLSNLSRCEAQQE